MQSCCCFGIYIAIAEKYDYLQKDSYKKTENYVVLPITLNREITVKNRKI